MALTVYSNIPSLTAQRHLSNSTISLSKSLERLSSGLRINRAGDDAAGLAISEALRAQIRGLNQAVRNANDGLSVVATAEGTLDESTLILQRIRELAVQASNDTNSATNRASIQAEIDQSISELNRIANTVQFNGLNLLDGTFSGKVIQVGSMQNQTISLTISDMRATALGKVATVTGTEVVGNLTAGELTLNGVSVGATSNDGVSFANANASAIAVAAAINAVASQSDVTAEANALAVTGQGGSTTTTAVNGIATGGLTLNGEAIAASVAGDDTVSNFENANSAIAVAATINDSTADTNVAAVAAAATVTFDDNGTVQNIDVDGVANILTINGVSVTADLTGEAAGEESALALAVAINATVALDGVVTASTDGAGHLILTGAADGRNVDVSTAGTSTTAGEDLGLVAAGDLAQTAYKGTVTLNSTSSDAIVVAGTATGFTAGTYQNSGISAVVLDGATNSLTINGVNVGAVSVEDDDAGGMLVDAINEWSTQTGVEASLNSSNQLVLTAADGRNVTVTTTGTVGGALGLTGATTVNATNDTTASTIALYAGSAFSVGGTNPADAGLAEQSVAVDDSTALTYVDVRTLAGAADAIRTVDFALKNVSESRSQLGAVTNRLEATVRNLQNVSENLSASDSRIRDVDFASETAQMMRAQILQQAGVAILAQANLAPQAALSLLGG